MYWIISSHDIQVHASSFITIIIEATGYELSKRNRTGIELSDIFIAVSSLVILSLFDFMCTTVK